MPSHYVCRQIGRRGIRYFVFLRLKTAIFIRKSESFIFIVLVK
nr:MAG TPA: hypothetical protein [Caudoviricetes sp.]